MTIEKEIFVPVFLMGEGWIVVRGNIGFGIPQSFETKQKAIEHAEKLNKMHGLL